MTTNQPVRPKPWRQRQRLSWLRKPEWKTQSQKWSLSSQSPNRPLPKFPHQRRQPSVTKKRSKNIGQNTNRSCLHPNILNGHTRDTRIGVDAQRVGPAPYMTPLQPVPTTNYKSYYTGPANQWSRPASPSPAEPPKDKLTTVKVYRDDENMIYLGLKVYVNTGEDGAEVEITGRVGDVLSDDDEDRLSERGRNPNRGRSSSRSRSGSQRRSRTVSSSRSPLRR